MELLDFLFLISRDTNFFFADDKEELFLKMILPSWVKDINIFSNQAKYSELYSREKLQ